MLRTQWRRIEPKGSPVLAEARLQAHYAVQWLARAARAYAPTEPDDAHTNLGWDDNFDGFMTHPLSNGVRLAASLPGPTLALMNANATKPSQMYLLRGRPDSQARAWLGQQVRALGFDPAALDAPSPWEMPPHPIANGADYRAEGLDEGLIALAAWFANANRSLGRIQQDYAARGLLVSPVRCWPHHFDIATLISLDKGGRGHARSVNVGLSPGDRSYNEPYYYVSPWPYPDAGRLPVLPPLGHWHTGGFTAAIVPASRIVASKDAQTETEAFLYVAVEALIGALA